MHRGDQAAKNGKLNNNRISFGPMDGRAVAFGTRRSGVVQVSRRALNEGDWQKKEAVQEKTRLKTPEVQFVPPLREPRARKRNQAAISISRSIPVGTGIINTHALFPFTFYL